MSLRFFYEYSYCSYGVNQVWFVQTPVYENMVPTPTLLSSSIKIECGTRPS